MLAFSEAGRETILKVGVYGASGEGKTYLGCTACGYTKKRQPASVALLHVGAVTAEDIELFIEHTRGAP